MYNRDLAEFDGGQLGSAIWPRKEEGCQRKEKNIKNPE
jgi:hypothetical protein